MRSFDTEPQLTSNDTLCRAEEERYFLDLMYIYIFEREALLFIKKLSGYRCSLYNIEFGYSYI